MFVGKRAVDGSEHALKIIQKTDIDWKLLAREVEILQQLDHPNILRFHELILTKTECVIVTELLRGGELYSRLVKMEKFSESEAHAVVSQLLSAMEYAHRNGIMHRDLKPENIMLVDQSPDSPIKIIDWGLARPLSRSAMRLSSDIGTPSYVAPEVLCSKKYCEKCDIWSIGVIAFELMVGYLPFNAFDGHFIETLQSGKVDFKKEDWDDISPSAKDLIKHMLVPDPAARYSASEARNHPWVRLGATKRTPLRSLGGSIADRVRDRERRKSYIVRSDISHSQIGRAHV